MTAEIAIRQPQAMPLPDKIRYAQALADSNLLPAQYRKNPPNLLFALEYAEALGVSPIHALTSIHVIEGKPSASADLIASLVRRAGHRLRVSGDDTYALAQIIRADDPDFTFEARWDMGRARAAGLVNKAVWKSYPAAMLRARAITEVARSAAPDALFGVIYTPEELGATVDADGDVITAPAVEQPSQPPVSAADRVRAGMNRRGGGVRAAVNASIEKAADQAGVAVDTGTGEVIDAEVVDEPPITKAQLTALNAAMSSAFGFSTREDKLAYLSEQLGRPIGSSSEVTKAEASALIDRIKRYEEQEAAEAALPIEEPPAEEDWPGVATVGVQ